MNLMDSLLNRILPDLTLPLHEKKQKGWVNGKYYDIYTYWQQDDLYYESVFERLNVNHPYEQEFWIVSSIFKPMINFFGEENFIEFVEWKFGLKISSQFKFKRESND